MSSTAIMALIKEKEKELEKMTKINKRTEEFASSLSCVSQNYINAGKALGEVGTIGGQKFDCGKTEALGKKYGVMADDLKGSLSTLKGDIADLEEEIKNLYIDYDRAVEREREAMLEEEKARARQNIRNKK